MARRRLPRNVTYFEPVPPRLAPKRALGIRGGDGFVPKLPERVAHEVKHAGFVFDDQYAAIAFVRGSNLRVLIFCRIRLCSRQEDADSAVRPSCT
jgi:hypothetical protein